MQEVIIINEIVVNRNRSLNKKVIFNVCHEHTLENPY